MEYRVSRPHQIGPAVRDARKKAGLTQAEVAERAGVSRRFVSELEAGTRPGAEFARVLAVLGALRRDLIVAPARALEPEAFADLETLGGTSIVALHTH